MGTGAGYGALRRDIREAASVFAAAVLEPPGKLHSVSEHMGW